MTTRRVAPTTGNRHTRVDSDPWPCKACNRLVRFTYPGANIVDHSTGVVHRESCTVFDGRLAGQIAAAARAKEDAIRRTDEHAPDEWKREAAEVITRVAASMREFTADDLWDAGLSHPPTPAALGPALRTAQAAGICTPTDVLVPTRLERRHRDVRVWQSHMAPAAFSNDDLDFAPAI